MYPAIKDGEVDLPNASRALGQASLAFGVSESVDKNFYFFFNSPSC